ncbi:hypothetical protein BJX96DRAFT_173031 [Aspergillus floccosus]
MTPSTDSSVRLKDTNAKPLCAADGAVYLAALRSRNVASCPKGIPWQDQLIDADTRWANRRGSSGLLHAKEVRDRYWNECTLHQITPFFLTEWLVGMPSSLRFSFDSPWTVEPLTCYTSDAPVLRTPRPSLTVGLQSSYFLTGKAFRDLQPYVAPIERDQALTFPFLAVEIAPGDSVLGISQNLYNAAVMLRNQRFLWERTHADVKGFDGIIRALSVTISRNVVEVFGHWTVYEDGEVLYMHAKVWSWWLTDKNEDWCRARAGLEECCWLILGKSEVWIPESLKVLKQTA